MNKFVSFMRSTPKRVYVLLAIAVATLVVPAVLHAWGPTRQTYTIESPASKVTFNSITNNPNIGDERNFVGIRENGTTGQWLDSQKVERGKEYVVRLYVHNNAASSLNLVAQNVTAKVTLPTTTGTSIQVNGFINSTNADPVEVYDHATFTGGENFNLAYVPGTLKYYNNANGNGFTIPESVFTSAGAKLGYSQMDGNIPGCFQYAGYLTFVVKPQFAAKNDFSMQKVVSKKGENKWVDNYTAKPGEEVDYMITYRNTGEVQQNNVTFRDKLPASMTYVDGSAKWGNSRGTYTAVGNVTTTGVNVGSYAPGANAWLMFSAKVTSADKLVCGANNLRNVAQVLPESMNPKEDDAIVTVSKECEEVKDIKVCELDTKNIITIKENEYDKSKHSKNLADCEEKAKPIKVCELDSKDIVTIEEKDFDSNKHSKNLEDCKEEPTTPTTPSVPTTPTTPSELPHTGIGDSVLQVVGLGSLVAAGYYYLASRRIA